MEEIRNRILERDNHTCAYCEYKNEDEMHVNQIDGNPKNDSDDNLESVCRDCEKFNHAGFWSRVQGILELYQESKYSQNDIIIRTRELRSQGKTDQEIKELLG